MAAEGQVSGGLEWRVTVPEGSSVKVEPESLVPKASRVLVGTVTRMKSKVLGFGKKVKKIAADDPRKVIHCFKVGLALALVSLFYYTRPLYDGVGGAAMWAVMTVVVVFEYSIGGSLYKGINRAIATFSAGALAVGVHWAASKSSETMEPIIRSGSVFILASAATFSRFIPTIKARFDYGVTIFILTFSFVAVSGYRVDKLLELAQQRLSTIAIGISICFLVAFLVCPVWAGGDLHLLVARNMDKLADSLEGCVDEYFEKGGSGDRKEGPSPKSQGYKCVLNAKASEDSLANLARWEPAHGGFGFKHPWSLYLKVGEAMRHCACCIEALNGCINSEMQVAEAVKKHLNEACTRLSSECSKVLKESSSTVKSMQQSQSIDFLMGEMNDAVQELQSTLSSLPCSQSTLSQPAQALLIMESLPLITVASLLIEVAGRVEGVVDAVDKLATNGNFKAAADEKPQKTGPVATQRDNAV